MSFYQWFSLFFQATKIRHTSRGCGFIWDSRSVANAVTGSDWSRRRPSKLFFRSNHTINNNNNNIQSIDPNPVTITVDASSESVRSTTTTKSVFSQTLKIAHHLLREAFGTFTQSILTIGRITKIY